MDLWAKLDSEPIVLGWTDVRPITEALGSLGRTREGIELLIERLGATRNLGLAACVLSTVWRFCVEIERWGQSPEVAYRLLCGLFSASEYRASVVFHERFMPLFVDILECVDRGNIDAHFVIRVCEAALIAAESQIVFDQRILDNLDLVGRALVVIEQFREDESLIDLRRNYSRLQEVQRIRWPKG